MEFKIGDNTITFNHSGWLCDSLESDDTINKRKNHHDRWSCALNVNKYVCSHILACMLLLVSIGLWCDAFRYANGFPESKVDLKTILGDING